MPGHGESSFDPANHTVDSIAESSIELLGSIGVSKAIVAGISIGGYILLKMMARRPDLFDAMVMICTKAEADTDEIKARRRAQIENIRTNGLRAFVETTAPKRVGPRIVSGRPWVVDWIKLMNYTVSAEANAATLEAMALKADDTATLPKITVPALILSGSDDIFIPKESPYNLKNGIKNSVHHVIDGAGHVASLEYPEVVNKHMETFLKTI
jgi:pimeloyl-ACP methyl ester carboxylesterase